MAKVKSETSSGDVYEWFDMADAPTTRPIFITRNPDEDPDGMIFEWRVTRVRVNGVKGWQPKAFWSSVLNKREIWFIPMGWREAAGPAAIQGDMRRRQEAASAAAIMAERRAQQEAEARQTPVAGDDEFSSWQQEEAPRHKAPALPPFKGRVAA